MPSAIGSIKYVILCTRPIVYLVMSLARGYNSNLEVDHWTTVKIILRGIRMCFSIMDTKVKGYVDANFDTNPDNSE